MKDRTCRLIYISTNFVLKWVCRLNLIVLKELEKLVSICRCIYTSIILILHVIAIFSFAVLVEICHVWIAFGTFLSWDWLFASKIQSTHVLAILGQNTWYSFVGHF